MDMTTAVTIFLKQALRNLATSLFCMITNNIKEFERVPLLKYENWLK